MCVGFGLPADTLRLPGVSHLVVDGYRIADRVTWIAWSDTVGQPIGLAFVDAERTEPGTPFRIRAQRGRMIHAEVAATPFYNPDNARQNL